jgi:MYXO-CTERM domain-containing protein
VRTPAVILTLALLGAPSGAAAWCRTTTVTQTDPTVCVGTGAPLTWPVRCVSLSLYPEALPPNIGAVQVRGLLADALAAWGGVRCGAERVSLDLSVGADAAAGAGYAQQGPNTNVVAFIREWRAAGLPPSTIAQTTLTFGVTSGQIKDADILVNTSIPLSLDTTAVSNDLPTALVHEVGHVLGLDHSPDRAAVMWYTAGRGELRRTPQPDDIAAVCAVHPPTLQRPCAATPEDNGCGCRTPGAGAPRSAGALAAALLAGAYVRRRRPPGATRPPRC